MRSRTDFSAELDRSRGLNRPNRLSWVGWVNWVGWFLVVLRLTGRVEIMKSNSPFIPLARNEGGWWCVLGGVLLFRVLSGVVPWALGFLASGFGMGPGVSSPL